MALLRLRRQHLSDRSRDASLTTTPQKFYPDQPSRQAAVRHTFAPARVQSESCFLSNAQPDPRFSHEQIQRQSSYQFQWERTSEPIHHNPFTTSPQTTSGTPWQSKLICSAVECEFEVVQLKDPPFPFYQHWDQGAEHFFGRGEKIKRIDYDGYGDEEGDNNDGYEGDDWYDEEPAVNHRGFYSGFPVVQGRVFATLFDCGGADCNNEDTEYGEYDKDTVEGVCREAESQQDESTYAREGYGQKNSFDSEEEYGEDPSTMTTMAIELMGNLHMTGKEGRQEAEYDRNQPFHRRQG
jgi:hypothetical protein